MYKFSERQPDEELTLAIAEYRKAREELQKEINELKNRGSITLADQAEIVPKRKKILSQFSKILESLNGKPYPKITEDLIDFNNQNPLKLLESKEE